jgi:hypothetical protein
MKILLRAIALTRSFALKRQFAVVERIAHSLPLSQKRELLQLAQREFAQAAQAPVPYLYGSAAITPYAPFGNGTELAMERIKSDNQPLRLRGLALWLAIAYHETRDAQQYGEFANLHKAIQRSVRTLKESISKRGDLPAELAIVA